MTGRNNSLISLLGGAAAGAIAMYLLDPEQGRSRREQLGQSAGGAVSGAGGSLGRAWDNVSEHAKSIGARVAAEAAAAGERLSGAAHDLSSSDVVAHARSAAATAAAGAEDHLTAIGQDILGRVRGFRDRLTGKAEDVRQDFVDRAQGAADRTRDNVTSARRSVGAWIAGEEQSESHLFAHTVGTAAVVALGAGAMYFLDPDRGRDRRAWAGGKVGQIVDETGRAFHRTGASVGRMLNRGKGVTQDGGETAASGGSVVSEQLLERVRSTIERSATHANQIQVMTDAEGHVELTGRVMANELDDLLSAVRSVDGVLRITNRLTAFDRDDQMTGGSQADAAVPQM